jgi:hypothetical protein
MRSNFFVHRVFVEITRASEFLEFLMSLMNFYHVFHSLARRCTSLAAGYTGVTVVCASPDPQNEFKLFRAHVFVEIRRPSKFLKFSKSLMNFYHVFHSLARRCTSLPAGCTGVIVVCASPDPQNEFKLLRAHVFVEITHPFEFLEFSISLTNFYHVFDSLARRCTSLPAGCTRVTVVCASPDPQNEFKLLRAHVFIEITRPSEFLEFSMSLMNCYHVFHSLARPCTSSRPDAQG